MTSHSSIPNRKSTRSFTPVDTLSNQYLRSLAKHDPPTATALGLRGYDHDLPDYSPEWHEEGYDLARNTLYQLSQFPDADSIDAASRDVLQEALNNTIALYETGLGLGEMNVIASPIQAIIDQFELLDLESSEGKEAALSRLSQIPRALTGYARSLKKRIEDNVFPLRILQIDKLLEQVPRQVNIIKKYRRFFLHDPSALNLFDRYAAASAQAYTIFSGRLKNYQSYAIEENAVGKDAYAIFSRLFLGETIDFAQAYAWGQDFLADIIHEQTQLAHKIVPHGSIAQASAQLDKDPQYLLSGRDALTNWMQEISQSAIQALHGTHFNIPPELYSLECLIAPTGTGGIYYTAPSEDFTRPGRMWWSVPDGINSFFTWQERTTVYHEGIPGHHLQIGTAVLSPELNHYRKLASFISGHGEGWALYAERLMDELGFLPTPGDRLGMLDAQRLRAARVILDIGYHCQFPAPKSIGAGRWDYHKAWHFLRSHVISKDEKMLRFELHRYLGWPGQAPSYAIGQQYWIDLRDEFLRRNPQETIRTFHTKALELGGIGLAGLRKHVLQ